MDPTHFTGFLLWILRISLHPKFPSNCQDFITTQTAFLLSYKTTLHNRSENSPFSRNLVIAERKSRGQGGVMWTVDHKRSDANYIAWINLIESNTTHCAKLGLMRAQGSYIGSSDRPRPLWGLFLSQFGKTEGRRFMNALHSPQERTQ